MKHKTSVLGGTFDRFHKGHKAFLDAAFNQSEKVTIGIASPTLFRNKKLSHIIEDFQTRKNSVIKYLSEKNFLSRSELIQIDDIYGNTLKAENIDALFATADTLKNAEIINIKRVEKGLKSLSIVPVELVNAEDNLPISSERIRNGEIDREGISYFKLLFSKKRFILTDEQRHELKEPFGKLLKQTNDLSKFLSSDFLLIAVGDIIVMKLVKQNIIPNISLIDFKTMRHNISPNEKKILEKYSTQTITHHGSNQAGMIERRAVGLIIKALFDFQQSHKKQLLQINGEEDLLVIPCIALSPLESIVVYGQPERGFVVIKVTEKKKKEIKELLSRMR